MEKQNVVEWYPRGDFCHHAAAMLAAVATLEPFLAVLRTVNCMTGEE